MQPGIRYSVLALAIYILWQYVIQGNIVRDAFKQIITQGGNIASLLKQMNNVSSGLAISQLLNTFSYMALASSFLGVSLGLLDYLADLFTLSDDAAGCTKQNRAGDLCATDIGRAAITQCFPVRDRFRRAGGYPLGSDRAGALMARASRRRFP